MKHPLKHSILPGVLSLLLCTACSKSALVTPAEQNHVNEQPVNAGEASALDTTPVGTVTYSSNGYTVRFTNNDATFDNAVYQQMINTFFTVYPKLVTRFYPGAAKQVSFTIDPNYNGVAYTSGTSVTYSAAWFHSRPQDVDVVTHEVMHIVQAYTGGAPGWLTEASQTMYATGMALTTALPDGHCPPGHHRKTTQTPTALPPAFLYGWNCVCAAPSLTT
jgi:hypothetical protein